MVRGLVKGFANIICHIIYRYDVEGLENLPKDSSALLCSNHIHLLDSVSIVIYIKRMIYIMVKAELMRSKFGNWFFNKLGCFAVERGKGDTKAIATAEDHLSKGELMLIFPEGTRNGMAKGVKVKKGAAMLALQTKTPIIPIGIAGTFKPFSKIKIRIGRPMDLTKYFEKEETSLRDYVTLTNEIMEEIIKLREE